jgi:hypothetical protein
MTSTNRINLFSLSILFITGSFLLLASCKKSNVDDVIPNVPVNFTIQLSLPGYSNLNSVGGSVEIPSAGYKGVVVYKRAIDDFVAYEMACTYDPTTDGAILHIDSSMISMVDNHCTSKFNMVDGSVLKGPATRPMKQYNTQYDAGNNTVLVYN